MREIYDPGLFEGKIRGHKPLVNSDGVVTLNGKQVGRLDPEGISGKCQIHWIEVHTQAHKTHESFMNGVVEGSPEGRLSLVVSASSALGDVLVSNNNLDSRFKRPHKTTKQGFEIKVDVLEE